jgi:uncharacterized RDD family membrane protein YckC
MELDDRLTISTPEGVDLTLTLAGVGSRFVSAMVDLLIQIGLIVAISLLAGAVGAGVGAGYAAALIAILSFLVVFGYDVFFEVLQSGRTPGKRLNGLRVVRSAGEPITFVPSAIRNVLRIIDFLPGGYLTGIVAILATRRNQRLGDLVAGTIVVRERLGTIDRKPWAASRPIIPTDVPGGLTLDLSAITPDEEAAVRRYLERRFEIDAEARTRIAQTLANRLRPKVAGIPEGLTAETFLEAIVATRSASWRRGTPPSTG